MPYLRHKLDAYYRRTLAWRGAGGGEAVAVPASAPAARDAGVRVPGSELARGNVGWRRSWATLRRWLAWLRGEARETFLVVWPTVNGAYQLLQFVYLVSVEGPRSHPPNCLSRTVPHTTLTGALKHACATLAVELRVRAHAAPRRVDASGTASHGAHDS